MAHATTLRVTRVDECDTAADAAIAETAAQDALTLQQGRVDYLSGTVVRDGNTVTLEVVYEHAGRRS